jgi:fumarate reductase subunit C
MQQDFIRLFNKRNLMWTVVRFFLVLIIMNNTSSFGQQFIDFLCLVALNFITTRSVLENLFGGDND